MAASKGCAFASEQTGDKEWHTTTKADHAVEVAEGEPEAATCVAPAEKNVVIQVAADTMGIGDDELGHKLLKGFISRSRSCPSSPRRCSSTTPAPA